MICYWEFLKMILNVILPIDMLAMKKLVYDFVDEVRSVVLFGEVAGDLKNLASD